MSMFKKRTKKGENAEETVKTVIIKCDTPELKSHIIKWCDNEGLSFDSFVEGLSLITMDNPVEFYQYNESTFKCKMDSGKELQVKLFFGDYIDFCSRIDVTDVDIKESYEVYTRDSKNLSDNLEMVINFCGRTITRNSMEVSSSYYTYCCGYCVKIDTNHELCIQIIRALDTNDDESWICKESILEEYLLNYDYAAFDIQKLYAEFIALTGVNIQQMDTIGIDYVEKSDQRSLAKITVKDGAITEYAYLEEGKSYYVSYDGSWSYSSTDCRIEFDKSSNQLYCSFEGNEEELGKINISELISKVKAKLKWDNV